VEEIGLDEVDVGDTQAVEVPVIQEADNHPFFSCGKLLMTGAEVLAAERIPIKGDPAQVHTIVKLGVKETPDPFFLFIDKSEELTVIDGFIELCALQARHFVTVSPRIVAQQGEDLGPPTQSLSQHPASVIPVIIESAAGPA
jgi:hypothetical protein